MSTTAQLMREWNKHLEDGTNMSLNEAVSAFTVVPEAHHETMEKGPIAGAVKDIKKGVKAGEQASKSLDSATEAKRPIRVKKSEMVGSASNAYGVRRKNIDTLMTTTHKLMTALDKSQKKDSENWAHVGTAGEIANKLSDINQMLGGI